MYKWILGSRREITTTGGNLYFLANQIDMNHTGIYSGQTLEEWEDEEYLLIISTNSNRFRKCFTCNQYFDIALENSSGYIGELPFCDTCMRDLDNRYQQQAQDYGGERI